MLLFKRVACNDCHVWTVGFFGRGFCGRQGGRGPESGADCEVDWRGIGGGRGFGGVGGLGKRSGEEGEVSRRGSGKAGHMRLRHTKEMCSSGKFVYFWEVLQIFHRQIFIFWGYLTPPPLPPFVVWTNCVAQRPLSQYEKVCSLSLLTPSSTPSLLLFVSSPHLSFQTFTDSMCIFECKG